MHAGGTVVNGTGASTTIRTGFTVGPGSTTASIHGGVNGASIVAPTRVGFGAVLHQSTLAAAPAAHRRCGRRRRRP